MSWQQLRSSQFLFICILSLGILLQILGADISFWDTIAQDDIIESSLLNLVVVIPSVPPLSPLACQWTSADEFPRYALMVQDLIFRPPLSSVYTPRSADV